MAAHRSLPVWSLGNRPWPCQLHVALCGPLVTPLEGLSAWTQAWGQFPALPFTDSVPMGKSLLSEP